MSNTENFISLCKEFEQAVESRYGRRQSAYHTLMQNPEYRKYWQDIDVIREIRNLYQHNVVEVGGKEAVVVTEETTDTLRRIINLIENPPLVKDVYTRDLIWVRMTDTISKVLELMEKNHLSHIPILEDKKLVGVFSKTTLFHVLIEGGTIGLDPAQPVSSCAEHLGIDHHQSESFGFIGLFERQAEAQRRFARFYENDKRLTALYVTEHGKSSETVLGVLTLWDLL